MWFAAASDGFSLTSLYVDASGPGYMAQGGLGQRRLRALCDGVERLGDARCRELAEALLRSCRGVAGGPQAAAAELACVEVCLPPLPHHLCRSKDMPLRRACTILSPAIRDFPISMLPAQGRMGLAKRQPRVAMAIPWLTMLHMLKVSFS